MMQRFTAYRRNLSERGTHSASQANADDQPQFEGVIWTDGTVTLRWLTAMKSTSVWSNIADMLEIHGHPEYGTEIVWHDASPPPQWFALEFALSIVKDKPRANKLVEALEQSAQGWDNIIELKLIPDQHVLSATLLRDNAREALAAAKALT